MITVLQAFSMVLTLIGLLVLCAFGGLLLGAWVHHRGVSIGSGNKETFTGRVPEGEVFRIAGADDLEDTPQTVSQNLDKTIAARADRFLSAVMGGKGV